MRRGLLLLLLVAFASACATTPPPPVVGLVSVDSIDNDSACPPRRVGHFCASSCIYKRLFGYDEEGRAIVQRYHGKCVEKQNLICTARDSSGACTHYACECRQRGDVPIDYVPAEEELDYKEAD